MLPAPNFHKASGEEVNSNTSGGASRSEKTKNGEAFNTGHLPEWVLADFYCKEPESKYFEL